MTVWLTSGGVETTVTIYDSPKDASRSYTTDASGKAANEDGYTTTAENGIMKNDRTLGEISISKVDLDAQRYVTGDAAHAVARVRARSGSSGSRRAAPYSRTAFSARRLAAIRSAICS